VSSGSLQSLSSPPILCPSHTNTPRLRNSLPFVHCPLLSQ
jgi:hypothetical protein